jgi:hypothetical protein
MNRWSAEERFPHAFHRVMGYPKAQAEDAFAPLKHDVVVRRFIGFVEDAFRSQVSISGQKRSEGLRDGGEDVDLGDWSATRVRVKPAVNVRSSMISESRAHAA